MRPARFVCGSLPFSPLSGTDELRSPAPATTPGPLRPRPRRRRGRHARPGVGSRSPGWTDPAVRRSGSSRRVRVMRLTFSSQAARAPESRPGTPGQRPREPPPPPERRPPDANAGSGRAVVRPSPLEEDDGCGQDEQRDGEPDELVAELGVLAGVSDPCAREPRRWRSPRGSVPWRPPRRRPRAVRSGVATPGGRRSRSSRALRGGGARRRRARRGDGWARR